MPIMTEKGYKLVCPICGVAYDDGDTVPIFWSKLDAENFVIGSLGWSDGEPMERAIARACRIIGCGEAAWDKKHPRKKTK